jgi:uncharacterized membrane protein
MSYLVKNAHFMVNHFPIALLICSFLFDLGAVIWKKKEWHTAGFLTLIIGTLGAIAAVMTGPENDRNPLLHTHELFAKITMVLWIILSLIRIYFKWKKSNELGKHPIYLVGALIGVLLVSYTGHLGGLMSHPDRSMFHNQFRNQPQTQSGQQSNQNQP